MRFVHFFAPIFLLVISCSPPDIARLAKAAEETTDSSLVTVLKVLTNNDVADMSAPEKIPESELPIAETYHIRTKVVIEGMVMSYPVDGQIAGGKTVKGTWWARTPEQAKRDLVHAEKIFERVGLKFHVTELSYREYTSHFIDHFIDANKYPDMMTVVYMMPKKFEFDGHSSGPWQKVNKGIIVGYSADEWTLAHEIGHYFGLLHPFTNDLVEDTPEQNGWCFGEVDGTLNCGNIMNYCNHGTEMITEGQVERMRRFIRAGRAGHILPDYDDILLLFGPKMTVNSVLNPEN